MIKLISLMILASLIVFGQAGCGGGHDHSEVGHHHDPPHGGAGGHDHSEVGHHHDPPHGGAGVTLGDEDAHIEFLVDEEAGTVTAWFFTPHMEQYLRIKAESFEVLAKLPDGEVVLTFVAVANAGTGETVGDTSQFVARADWLTGSGSFDAVLSEVSVRGKVYRSIGFNYPEGN